MNNPNFLEGAKKVILRSLSKLNQPNSPNSIILQIVWVGAGLALYFHLQAQLNWVNLN
jgi:hypothetical protein